MAGASFTTLTDTKDPRAAVKERVVRGAGRLALPVTAFLPISNNSDPLRRGDHQALRERVRIEAHWRCDAAVIASERTIPTLAPT